MQAYPHFRYFPPFSPCVPSSSPSAAILQAAITSLTHHQHVCSLPNVFHFLGLSQLPSNHSLISYRDNLPQLLGSFKISSLLCLALSSSLYLNIFPPFPLWGNWPVSVLHLYPKEFFPLRQICSPLPLLNSLFSSQPIPFTFTFPQRSSKEDTAQKFASAEPNHEIEFAYANEIFQINFQNHVQTGIKHNLTCSPPPNSKQYF